MFDRNDTKRKLIKTLQMTREERKSVRPELYCTSVSITFAFEVYLWGLRYQLLCLSRSLYRDELLPGCHYGALQSPWKLHKYSITDKTSTMKSITHSFIYLFLESSVEGFSWPGETARTLVAKDIPFIHEDSPYAPLCFTTSRCSSCLEC